MYLYIYPKYNKDDEITDDFINLVDGLLDTCGYYFNCVDEYRMACFSDVTNIKFINDVIVLTFDDRYVRTIVLPTDICFFSVEHISKDYELDDLLEFEKLENQRC